MTAPDPEATKPRRPLPPAVWMSVLAALFVLIGALAVGVSIMSRYGAEIAQAVGVAPNEAPLRGDWALSQRAPVGTVKWSFSRDGWGESPSSVKGMRQFDDAADGCTLFLAMEPMPPIPNLAADAKVSDAALGGMIRSTRASATHVERTEPAKAAWVAVGDAKVELTGTVMDFTPKGSSDDVTSYMYVRSFNASHQVAMLMIDCGKSAFDTSPSILGDVLHAASLVG